MEERHFVAGEVMLREGEAGDVAYLLKSGRVSITKSSPAGTLRLATMGPGQMVGEITLIDDKPRLASAVALEPVHARVLHKEQFRQVLKSDPEIAFRLLRVLAARLRDAHDTILTLQSADEALPEQSPQKAANSQSASHSAPSAERPMITTISPLTDAAVNALDGEDIVIDEYPYRIGRDSRSSSADNDWWIADVPPYQISRNHLAIIQDRRYVLVTDRGSHLGFAVDGERYGSGEGEERTAELALGAHELLIGGEDSPYRFRLSITTR